MELDPSKGYFLLVDNEDGTLTNTINAPALGIHEVVVIVPMTWDEYMAAAVMVMSEEGTMAEMLSQELTETSVVIPETVD